MRKGRVRKIIQAHPSLPERQHPGDLDKSHFGDSIGHWEGDTLVVNVVGLNDETWLGSGRVG